MAKAQNQPSRGDKVAPPEPLNKSSRGMGSQHQDAGRDDKGLPRASAASKAQNLTDTRFKPTRKRPLQVDKTSSAGVP